MADEILYKASEVNPLLADAAQVLDLSALALKEATDEAARLRKEAEDVRANPKVVLEKIAFDPKEVDAALDGLIRDGLLEPEHKQAFVADLAKDPNVALRIITKVATFSANAPSEGGGLPKLASESPNKPAQEEDPWKKVREQGA